MRSRFTTKVDTGLVCARCQNIRYTCDGPPGSCPVLSLSLRCPSLCCRRERTYYVEGRNASAPPLRCLRIRYSIRRHASTIPSSHGGDPYRSHHLSPPIAIRMAAGRQHPSTHEIMMHPVWLPFRAARRQGAPGRIYSCQMVFP